MAIVFGRLECKSLKQELIPLGILLAVPFVVVSILFDPNGDKVTELVSVGTVGAALTLLLIFVYARINPLSLQRVFRPELFRKHLSENSSVVHTLEQLDDNYYVFNNFVFELCGVEHMVVSQNGIFVIGKVNRAGGLHIRNNVLFAGDGPLETLTGNTWRICHLVNIILKKWFEVEYMPKPVLIAAQEKPPQIRDYDGMAIVTSDGLISLIKDGSQNLRPEIAYGFAKFMRERYVSTR